jgi:hypothetical protein
MDRGLRRAVRETAGMAEHSGDRSDVDDRPAALADHLGVDGLRPQHGAVDVGGEETFDHVKLDLRARRIVHVPCAIDEPRDRPEFALDTFGGRADGRLIGDITLVESASGIGREIVGFTARPVDQRHGEIRGVQ